MYKDILTAILSFFKKKVPAYSIVLVASATVIIFLSMKISEEPEKETSTSPAVPCNSTLSYTQLSGIFTRPLLMADISDQSEELFPLKKEIEDYLSAQKNEGHLNAASVYLQTLDNGKWISVNNELKYTSTGYIRLAILIWYLKKSEQSPLLLDKKLSFNPVQTSASPSGSRELRAGKQYSIRELLTTLFVKSDSDAKFLLSKNIDTIQFQKVFTDLGMTTPNLRDKEFLISVSDYSKFLRVLYDGHYLSMANSEFALELLSESESHNGMATRLPSDVKVAHRFSEKFSNNKFDVRESGIVYADHDPYVLTIFTQGKSDTDLKASVADISKMVFEKVMSGNKTASKP